MGRYSSGIPKTLFELEPGVTILDHIVERIRKLRPERILIVTRPEFKELIEGRIGKEAEIILTDLEDFGNLYTVSLALDRVGDDFLIVMSDHIFEQSILEELIDHWSDRAFTVCLDRSPSRSETLEGLKLLLRESDVVLTGKEVPPHYGIDTGLIMCRGRAKDYIRATVREKGPQARISDALNMAASSGDVDYVDVTGKVWKDVDTPEDLERARKLYWEILRRELVKPEDGLVSRYLNRPISTRISLMLYRRRIWVNPTIISSLSSILCLIAAFLLAEGSLLLGGLLAQVASLLDGVDGEVARLFKRSSKLGGFLDSLMDRVSDVALVAGLTLSLDLGRSALLLPILASANSVLVSYVTSGLAGAGVRIRVLRSIPATRDVRVFIIFLACSLSQPWLALWYLSTVPLIYLAASVYLAYRDLREPRSLRMPERRKPLPELSMERGELSVILREILSNLFRMIVALLLVRILSPVISDVTLISREDLLIRGELLLTSLDFLITIYFGYRILVPLKGLFDMASDRFAERMGVTRTTLGRIVTDLIYMTIGSILWVYLPRIAMQLLGEWISRLIYLGLAVLLMITAYDLMKTLYRTFGDLYSRLIEGLTKRIGGAG